MAAFLLLAALLGSSPPAAAQSNGYVVEVDSGVLYLDRGGGAASPGDAFVVYTEGAELKHPKTGASLGRIENDLARGVIDAVMPKYYTGHVVARREGGVSAISAGQYYRLAPPEARPESAAASGPPTRPAGPGEAAASHTPLWRSPVADLAAVDMAVGDVLGDGKTEIVLADERSVAAYPDDGGTGGAPAPSGAWKPVCRYADPDTGVKIVSIDAADLDQDGRAEIFVSDYNSFFNRVETMVLKCKDGVFAKETALPWLTRAYPSADGSWRLASQQLAEDRSFPFANIYDLEYKDGKYVQAGRALNLPRVDWAYGFALARDPAVGEPFHLFYTGTDSLRVQFKKGKWTSPDSYGQTASRIRWFDHHLMFRPRLATTQAGGAFTGLYTLRNNPGLGGLAGAFGLYNSSELIRLKWTGMSLEPDWKADLGGYAADVALARPDASRPEEVLVAVVGKGGKTSVWKFSP